MKPYDLGFGDKLQGVDDCCADTVDIFMQPKHENIRDFEDEVQRCRDYIIGRMEGTDMRIT